MTMLRLELLRIIGRRGTFFGVLGVALAIALLVAFLVDSSDQTPEVWTQALGVPLVFGSTLIWALAGSYDVSNGTVRYLVLTGTPRPQLVLQRIPALLVATLLAAAPAIVVAIFSMTQGPAPGDEIVRAIAGALVSASLWGLLAFFVGTMLHSSGAAIAVALVLNFVGGGITLFVQSQISQDVGNYLLPNLIGVVSNLGGSIPDGFPGEALVPFGAAVIGVVVWFVALGAAALLRVQRDEY